MKKIVSLLLCFLVALSVSACNVSLQTNLTMGKVQPWAENGRYERCTYAVTQKDGADNVLGSGTMITTIDEDPTNASNSIASVSFSFTYEKDGVQTTDVVESSTTFVHASMYALSSSKTITVGSDPQAGFRFVSNYITGTVEYYAGTSTTPTKTLTIDEDLRTQAFDNESFYYLIRAFEKETDGYGGNFNLVNLYDCYLDDAVTATSLYYRTEDEVNVSDPLWTDEKLENWGISGTGGKMPCYQAFLSRNTNPSGTPIQLFFLTPKKTFLGGKKKILVKVSQPVYHPVNGTLESSTEYVLTDYSYQK